MSDKIKDQKKQEDDKDFSFMKLLNEIKRESGLNINFTPNLQNEKSSKLKFEPNVNLKRNFIPNVDIDRKAQAAEQQNIVNLNEISSRFEARDSLNVKKPAKKNNTGKSNLVFLTDLLKSDAGEKKAKKIRNEDEDIRGIVNSLRQKDHTGYYPTTLPFKLNYTEESIFKDLITDKGCLRENNMFLFQFPRVIPYDLEVQEKMKNEELQSEEPSYDSNGYLLRPEFKNVFRSIKSNINIGKIKFYKSGKIKIEIGQTHFDLNAGISSKFAQEITLFSSQSNELVFLGKINDKKIIVTPDFQ